MLNDITNLSIQLMDSRQRDYQRYFIKTVSPKHRFMIITGERGVGKTTTLIQYLLKHAKGDLHSKDILYIQADHMIMQQTTLYEIAEMFSQMGGKYIAFDEIHKYPEWSMELKSIYDTFPELKIYASGSSALEILRGSHDLSRRALIKKMVGLSFREFIELKYEINLESYELTALLENHAKYSFQVVKQVEKNNLKILPLFREYIQSGYYPYFKEETSFQELLLLIEQNINATIESDLLAIYPSLTGTSIRRLKQLVSYIAGSVPFTPNWNKIKTIIGVSDDRTLKSYFKYLKDAMIIYLLTSSSSKLKTIASEEKVFLSNPNLLFALGYNEINLGTVRETFFISQLSMQNNVTLPGKGDFLIDNKFTFEVGGKNKKFEQIKGIKNSFVVADDIETGAGTKIPLWLFGFLY